jgi:hypothetical protein
MEKPMFARTVVGLALALLYYCPAMEGSIYYSWKTSRPKVHERYSVREYYIVIREKGGLDAFATKI